MNIEKIETVKSLIAEGRIAEAIDVLMQNRSNEGPLTNKLILLSARQAELNNKVITGDTSYAEINIIQNQITSALLSICESYTISINIKKSHKQTTNNSIKVEKLISVPNERSLKEMIALLEDRAEDISKELSIDKRKEKKLFLSQFKQYHNKMLDSLINSDLIRAHEINNKIQKLKHDLGYSKLIYNLSLPIVAYSASTFLGVAVATIGGPIGVIGAKVGAHIGCNPIEQKDNGEKQQSIKTSRRKKNVK